MIEDEEIGIGHDIIITPRFLPKTFARVLRGRKWEDATVISIEMSIFDDKEGKTRFMLYYYVRLFRNTKTGKPICGTYRDHEIKSFID